MKILMINSVCGVRSTGRICVDIAQALEKQGHECKIAYGRESVPEQYKRFAVRIGSDTSVKWHGLKARIFDSCGFESTRETRRFIKWVESYDPDIIHLHNLHGYYIDIRVLFEYIARANKPVVWTLHDCWAFTGHCAHFVSANCEKWKTLCESCPKKSDYPTSLLFDNSRKNFARKKALIDSVKSLTVVAPSKWLSNLARESFLSNADHEIIPNGINLDVFKPTESDFRVRYGLENKRVLLGVASAWHKGKGLYDMVEISKRLPEHCKLVMVGLTPDQLKIIPPQIIAITRTNNTGELAEIYSTADALINPTYADTFPTVNLEAQACGTPVVTYRTGGSPDGTLPENVVAQGDIDALIERAMCESLPLRQRDEFSLSLMSQRYSALYEKKISENSN